MYPMKNASIVARTSGLPGSLTSQCPGFGRGSRRLVTGALDALAPGDPAEG